MNSYHKDSQFELFPGKSDKANANPRRRHFFSSFTLTLENAILLSIFIVLGMVFFFSLGVERGKRIASDITEETEPIVEFVKVVEEPIAEAEYDEEAIKDTYATDETKHFTDSPAHSKIGDSKELVDKPVVKPEKTYTIQVASFKTETYAKKEAANLKKKLGYEITVLPKGEYSIVCVGRFSLKNKANTVLNELKKRYKDCLVRRL